MIERGVSLRELIRVWRSMGGDVQTARRTGEARFVHPCGKRSGLYNVRRKDAPLKLVRFVLRFSEELPAPSVRITLSSTATDSPQRRGNGTR